MSLYLKQLRNSPHLRWFAPALVVDWVVVLAVNALAQWIELQLPYRRDPERYLHDPSLQWPLTRERVPAGPNSPFDVYTFWLPVLVVVVVGGAFKRSLHDVHHGLLVLFSSRSLMRIVVESLKNRVGRLRPDFFARCEWDAVAHACTGALDLVKDGRRSFPSGHSSTSWQAMLFVALYLAGKNGAFALAAPFPKSGFLQSRLLRFGVVVAPLFLGTWICVTRLEDHRHHPADVVAGSLIGAVSALVMYAIYYPSPFIFAAAPPGADELSVMDKPRRVYGAKEAEERRDAWEYAEEGRVRLVEDAAEEAAEQSR
ncbi:hypothetical protein JCM3774_001489 [Rhodotorula dairenensis]